MKHRGGAEQTGFGVNAHLYMRGNQSDGAISNDLLNEIAKDCYETFNFEKFGYCEAAFDSGEARFGVEPTYMYDALKLMVICENKLESKYVTGRAVGPWASTVIGSTREYGDYAYKSKFIRFVDKWHEKIFNKTP